MQVDAALQPGANAGIQRQEYCTAGIDGNWLDRLPQQHALISAGQFKARTVLILAGEKVLDFILD
jgi:hypothetical protein